MSGSATKVDALDVLSASTVAAVLCQPVSPFDDVGRLLADHDGGRGRVARGDLGHDGGVGHPQAGHP